MRNSRRAGGSLIAIGTIVGTVAGGLWGQPSLGLLVGFVIGAAGAIVVWLRDRTT